VRTRANLKDPNRFGEPLYAVLAQIDDTVSIERGACVLVSLLRDQDLAAVPGRSDPRSEVDVLADIPLGTGERLAGMEAHADRDGPRSQPVLNFRCGRDRSTSVVEGDEKRVTLCIDLYAAMTRHAFTNRRPVLG
jgi:hypothetical protein